MPNVQPAGTQPVRTIPDDAGKQPQPGIALCLSGGGYRAMVFHLGALWRLNELALLRNQEQLINWGYAICDAAMRAHVVRDAGPPAAFPYPAAGV